MAPELDIVEVRLLADAEDPDELVLASVERALAGVRFHPDSQVQDIVIDGAAGLEQLADMAPIHAYEMHSAIAGDRRGRRQRALEELYEVCARELTRRHRKFGVLDPSPTDNVAHVARYGLDCQSRCCFLDRLPHGLMREGFRVHDRQNSGAVTMPPRSNASSHPSRR